MMTRSNLIRLALNVSAAVAALQGASAFAKDEKPLSLIITAGAEYDSNVSVDQADLLTRQGDTAVVLGVAAKYKVALGEDSSLSFGYDFDQSLHTDLSAFDLQTHTASFGADTKVGGLGLGADYSFSHILLGGNSFLDIQQAGPSISGFLTKSIYLRASYVYLDKNFKLSDNRDATAHQGSGDAYYFFMKNKGFINIGGRYGTENAVDLALDYSSFQVGSVVQLPLPLLSDGAKVKFGYAYRERNYDNITPVIGAVRHENRSTYKVDAVVPFTEHLSFKPEYRYVDRNSNFASSNYTENVVTGALSYRF